MVTCGHAVTCVNNEIIKQLFVFTVLEYLLHIIATYIIMTKYDTLGLYELVII